MEGVFTAIERAALPKRAIYSDFAATLRRFVSIQSVYVQNWLITGEIDARSLEATLR